MKILVCNIGSHSLKFQLLDMNTEKDLARGWTERVGSPEATITYWVSGKEVFHWRQPVPSYRKAVSNAMEFLLDPKYQILSGVDEIAGVGFRAVQAGEKNGSVLLSKEVLDAMEEFRDLAPAHNPASLEAIATFRELLPKAPLIGVFEPGFHAGVPDYARVYGTPYEWMERYGVRKYGYQGASHRYVAGETVKLLRLPPDKHRVISCHLGGSSSICAIRNGESIDTSMGFSPQTGLIQGTRVGDLDPFVFPYIMKRKGITLDEALAECSTKGGLAGLSGVSADMREILKAIDRGDKKALLARKKFIYDVKRYIGEYLVMLEGVDAITFTGGIGQHDAALREEVISSLGFLGLTMDEKKNASHDTIISSKNSPIAVLVLPANEEIVLARETVEVINATMNIKKSPPVLPTKRRYR